MRDGKCIQIGILGSPASPYVADLQRAATDIGGVSIEQIGFGDLQVRLGAKTCERVRSSRDNPLMDQPQVGWCSDSMAIRPDALLVRSMPLGSLEQVIFRMDCLQVWQSQSTLVFNSPRCLEISIDKWLTLHRLASEGLPVPATVCCQTRAQAMEAFEQLGCDVLLKPLFGGEGRGIMRLQEIDMAWRVLGTLQQLGQVLYVQQFIPNFRYDIRVLLIGDRVYSIKRRAPEGSYRSNISQGSVAAPHELSNEELDLARRAAESVGGSVVGVDLLPGLDGQTHVLEVNAVPGWRGLARALQVDVASQILLYLCEQVEIARTTPYSR